MIDDFVRLGVMSWSQCTATRRGVAEAGVLSGRTTAATVSGHRDRLQPELAYDHVLHPSPPDEPTPHIDLCKSPETATVGRSQILGPFYADPLLINI